MLASREKDRRQSGKSRRRARTKGAEEKGGCPAVRARCRDTQRHAETHTHRQTHTHTQRRTVAHTHTEADIERHPHRGRHRDASDAHRHRETETYTGACNALSRLPFCHGNTVGVSYFEPWKYEFLVRSGILMSAVDLFWRAPLFHDGRVSQRFSLACSASISCPKPLHWRLPMILPDWPSFVDFWGLALRSAWSWLERASGSRSESMQPANRLRSTRVGKSRLADLPWDPSPNKLHLNSPGQ